MCACVVRVLKKITIPEMSIYGCERAFLLSVTVVFMQISVDQRFFMGTFSGRAVLQCVLVNINLINQHTWSGGRLHSLKNRKTTEFSVAINFPLWFKFNDFPFGLNNFFLSLDGGHATTTNSSISGGLFIDAANCTVMGHANVGCGYSNQVTTVISPPFEPI